MYPKSMKFDLGIGSCNWYFRVLSSMHSKSKFKRLGYVLAIHGKFVECEHHPSSGQSPWISSTSSVTAQGLSLKLWPSIPSYSIHHHPSTGAEHIQHAANQFQLSSGWQIIRVKEKVPMMRPKYLQPSWINILLHMCNDVPCLYLRPGSNSFEPPCKAIASN